MCICMFVYHCVGVGVCADVCMCVCVCVGGGGGGRVYVCVCVVCVLHLRVLHCVLSLQCAIPQDTNCDCMVCSDPLITCTDCLYPRYALADYGRQHQ